MWWRDKSYEVLPALSIRGPELRRSLRLVTIAWMYGVVWMSCVSGSHVAVFTRMLGFREFDYGLLTAIPFIATFGQVLAAVFIERTGLRKYQFLECGTAHRLLWIAIAAIPLMGVPSRLAVLAMLSVMFVSSFMNALAAPAWMTWMGDLIPKRVRGRYFANRALYSRPVQIAVAIVLGVILDRVTLPESAGQPPPDPAAAQPLLLWTISGIFAVAAIFGATDILLFHKVREVLPTRRDGRPPVLRSDVPVPQRKSLGTMLLYRLKCAAEVVPQVLVEPFRDRVFRNYVGYGATITFAMSVGGWFFWRNALENLKFSKLGTNFMFLVVGPVLGLIGAQWWGKLIDRWGRRPVLFLATMMTTVSVMPWFFASRDIPSPAFAGEALNWLGRTASGLVNLLAGLMGQSARVNWVLVDADTPLGAYLVASLASIIGGIAWTGINLAQTGVVLGFSDGHGRSKFVAASAVMISVGGILGGLAGGATAQWLEPFLKDNPIRLGPFLWNQWHATFFLSDLARFLSLLWLVNMPDPGARSVRDVVRYYGGNAYNYMANWLFYPLRVFGWGRSEDSAEK